MLDVHIPSQDLYHILLAFADAVDNPQVLTLDEPSDTRNTGSSYVILNLGYRKFRSVSMPLPLLAVYSGTQSRPRTPKPYFQPRSRVADHDVLCVEAMHLAAVDQKGDRRRILASMS